jgi:hypothetical protein
MSRLSTVRAGSFRASKTISFTPQDCARPMADATLRTDRRFKCRLKGGATVNAISQRNTAHSCPCLFVVPPVKRARSQVLVSALSSKIGTRNYSIFENRFEGWRWVDLWTLLRVNWEGSLGVCSGLGECGVASGPPLRDANWVQLRRDDLAEFEGDS